MENILSHFIAGKLEIKLTSEKLFINTATSSEAFALRSVNGIGVIDLVEGYNAQLSIWEIEKRQQKIGIGVGVFIGLLGLYFIIQNWYIMGFGTVAFGLFIAVMGKMALDHREENEPKLISAVRIMMSGGNRDFQFDKTGVRSGNVAEFVAMVESTLSAYHKNGA